MKWTVRSSLEGFHAQLDRGNKNQTQLTLVKYMKCRVQKQNRAKQE